uniref:Uncharacterized protein n=1 Tax=Gopherus agassizii TaxID=38772 RepID=A0A452HB16_9SAUR
MRAGRKGSRRECQAKSSGAWDPGSSQGLRSASLFHRLRRARGRAAGSSPCPQNNRERLGRGGQFCPGPAAASSGVGWERGGDSPAGPRTPQLGSSSPQLLPGADAAPAWGCNGALSAPSLESFSQPLPASSAAGSSSPPSLRRFGCLCCCFSAPMSASTEKA